MSRMFADTVTLYHYAALDTWTRTVLRGVMWRQKTERAGYRSDRAYMANVTNVTVPLAVGRGVAFDAQGLDILVLGDCPRALSPDYTPADLRRDEPTFCVLAAVADFTRRPCLRHWKLTSLPRPVRRGSS